MPSLSSFRLTGFLLVLSSAFFMSCGSSETAETVVDESAVPNKPAGMTVGVFDVQPEAFSHRFSIQGNVETDMNSILTTEFAGLIEEVMVSEGAQVREGDVLIRINTDVLNRSMAELQSQLDLATELFNRQERLWKQNIGSELDFMQAQNQKITLENSMKTLLEQMDMAMIRAPFDGILDRCLAKTGEMAMPGSPLARVIDLRNMYVRASVSDHYAGRVSKGMPAEVIVSGVDTLATEIGRVGQFINPANRTLELTLPLPRGSALLPNMYASVWLQDVALDSAVVLPSALIQQDIEGQDYVFVAVSQQDGSVRAEKRSLNVGMGSGDSMLIQGGLVFGDRVVSKGATRIVSGQIIRIIGEE